MMYITTGVLVHKWENCVHILSMRVLVSVTVCCWYVCCWNTRATCGCVAWASCHLAVLMVSPSRVYLGFLDPITTAVVGPECSPTRIWTHSGARTSSLTAVEAAASTHAAAKRAIRAAWSASCRTEGIHYIMKKKSDKKTREYWNQMRVIEGSVAICLGRE